VSIGPGCVADAQALGATHSAKILKQVLHEGAMAFPVRRLGVDGASAWVLRPDLPRTNAKGKPVKYEYPAGTPNLLDVLPQYRAALSDPAIPLWVTEGAKKADALAAAFGDQIVPTSINGVYGWRGSNGAGGKVALPDLEEVAINGRSIVLAFDSDARTNKDIQTALARFGRLLVARGASSVAYLALPDGPNGAKWGVDDYLASGRSPAELQGTVTLLQAMQSHARISFGTHPDTGAPLTLPPGYDVHAGGIVKVGPRGDPVSVYPGMIYVRSLGDDLATHDEAVTLTWAGSCHGTLSLPRAEMAKAQALRDRLSARGALIHDSNAKLIAAYLTEFIGVNQDDLPRVAVASRLGVHDEVLVLPDRSIGGAGPVRYQSARPVVVGDDTDVYPAALRAMLDWDDLSIPSLVLGLAFSSPMVSRLHPRRNPALYLAGPPSSGKTTLIQFAIGAWGDPTRTPFRIEATRTSTAGYLQTLAGLGGLPLFVDEAHTAQYPDRLETLAYQFANGQSYTKGTVNGNAGGGELLSGALLMAGEARAEFLHSGARNRVIWLDGHEHSPLGTDCPDAGKARAAMLETAWERGAGQFGARLAEAAWRDWEAFEASVETLRTNDALQGAPTPWQHTLAIGMAAFVLAYDLVGVAISPDDQAALMEQWAALLVGGRAEADPAQDAFERLALLIIGAHEEPVSHGWIVRSINHEPVAYRLESEDVWRVPTKCSAVRDRLGSPAAVQLHGPTWARLGLVEPARDGKCTHVAKVGQEAQARVLRVPMQSLTSWHTAEEA
jgi:hypothetical protein